MNELQQRIFSQGVRGSVAGQRDRRREPRTRSARLVHVRSADPSDYCFEEVLTMTDFSRTGIYFVTARIESYSHGMKLYVIPSFGCFNFEFLGEVVRIESLPFDRRGIAVQLLRICNPLLKSPTVAK
jgi:hypothetical protein